ncbi:hypothetical protein ACQCT9_21425 [Sutcliffiella horikoshii]
MKTSVTRNQEERSRHRQYEALGERDFIEIFKGERKGKIRPRSLFQNLQKARKRPKKL